MGCLKWIVRVIFSLFLSLFLFGNWIGIYALSDVPSWMDGGYVQQIEQVVDAPVTKVYPYGQSQLKVVTTKQENPVIISTNQVEEPSRAVQMALLFTTLVQQGLTMTGGLLFVMTVVQIALAVLRMVL